MFLELRDVNFSYGRKQVLENISADFEVGTFTSLIGPNGCGKTTLMNLMTAFNRPSAGQIFLLGRDITKYSVAELSRIFAVVPQDIGFRFPFTCLEIVMMGRSPFAGRLSDPSEHDLRIVREAMEKTDTLQFLETPVTEISGGERQRVILAKALAQEPRVLFLDEAFSAMDVCYQIQLLRMLKREAEDGMDIISVMHDLNLADSFSDNVLALKKGRVYMHDSAENIMVPEHIKELFNVDVRKTGEKGLAVLA